MAEEHIRGCTKRRATIPLPQELQDEILVRLPVKTLIRFELVCKAWFFRLHSRSFIDLYDSCRHLRKSSSKQLRPISTGKLEKRIPGLADPCLHNKEGHWKCRFRILGPVNGVYCITNYPRESRRRWVSVLSSKIALLNPATRECKLTNPVPCEFHSLVSDVSSKSCQIYTGFGVMKDDCRVVVLITYHRKNTSEASFLALAYSAQKGVWKKLVDYEPGKRNVGEKKAAETEAFDVRGGGRRLLRILGYLEECPQRFLEGCWHWIATAKGRNREQWLLLSYNFAEESFKLIGMPPRQRETHVAGQRWCTKGGLFVLHDHLAAVYIFNVLPRVLSPVDEVAVWAMMEYGVEESWTKIRTIKPGFLCGFLKFDTCLLHGVHYTPLKNGGGIRIEGLVFRHRERIISCDGDEQYQVTNRKYPVKLLRWNTIGISTYVETLERLYKDSIMLSQTVWP